jgi:hypothetical protein
MRTLLSASQLKIGDVVWYKDSSSIKYVVKSRCTNSESICRKPCVIVRSLGSGNLGHLDRFFYGTGNWRFKSACMFGKE